MASPGTVLNRELSLLQIAVALVVLGALVAFFIDRVQRVEAAAEKAHVLAVYQNLQSLATMQRLHAMLGERVRANLVLEPVFSGLNRFAGAMAEVDWRLVEPGEWVFDTRRQWLVYRVVNESYFETELVAPKRIRFRVDIDFVDTNGNGRLDEGSEAVKGLKVVSLDAAALR